MKHTTVPRQGAHTIHMWSSIISTCQCTIGISNPEVVHISVGFCCSALISLLSSLKAAVKTTTDGPYERGEEHGHHCQSCQAIGRVEVILSVI